MNDRQPTPAIIRAARLKRDLSQSAAGDLIYVSRQSWRLYESGDTQIKLGLWELFLIKTGQFCIEPIITKRPKANRPGRVQNLRPFGPSR